ncbi:glutathione S-transferase Mu 1-like [Tropilaelaps mercedesae]|uniref:Glutathione S-transferase Mu 1-like n=1 Tax=Tropilaelaps mercedesae TaxID=418985 RepID=A0A1V9XUE1_9ACAR|nr:glutathione S-transferase Mu 1-like [Tropilaelaps mercedesae]
MIVKNIALIAVLTADSDTGHLTTPRIRIRSSPLKLPVTTQQLMEIRGLAQSIRFLLTYGGVDLEDKRYLTCPALDYDKSQ